MSIIPPESNSRNSIVCLLIVNQIQEFPEIVVRSILRNSKSKILIGYINQRDIHKIPEDPRVTSINLSSEIMNLNLANSQGYQGWKSEDFFQIIQLKWILLKKAFSTGVDIVIYNDIDVVWLQDAENFVTRATKTNQNGKIFIQSFTYYPDNPRLCMGFVYFSNSPIVLSFIDEAQKRHSLEFQKNPRIGDDDIVTLIYREKKFPDWIIELPQSSFPVGNALNQFNLKSRMPGLFADRPMIFHANFVGDLRNKLLLLRIFLTKSERRSLGVAFSPYWITLLSGKWIMYWKRQFTRYWKK
jgi:hypothetical protein